MNIFREQLAAFEHKQWAHWTRYMLDNLTPENIERWRRQCGTPYDQLSEAEKESDREWANRMLAEFGYMQLPSKGWEPAADGETRPVLVSTGVIVNAPDDETKRSERLLRIADLLQARVIPLTESLPDVFATGVTSFHHLTEPGANSFRCTTCGRWASDTSLPDQIPGLDSGERLGADRFQCEPCRVGDCSLPGTRPDEPCG